MTQHEWRDNFSSNLIDILKEKGMSQAELAIGAGLSRGRISEYVNGLATPTVFAIINMAYALDMEISDLVDFDERISW